MVQDMIIAGMLPAIAIVWACVGVGLMLAGTLGWRQAWLFRQQWRTAQVRAWEADINISLESQLLASLAESDRMRNELETIFNTVQDAMYVYSPAGKKLYGNAFSKQLFAPIAQYSQEESMRLMEVETLDGTPLPYEQLPLSRVLRGENIPGATLMRVRFPNMQ